MNKKIDYTFVVGVCFRENNMLEGELIPHYKIYSGKYYNKPRQL